MTDRMFNMDFSPYRNFNVMSNIVMKNSNQDNGSNEQSAMYVY